MSDSTAAASATGTTQGPLRAVQFGCGPIGCSVARLAAQRSNIELVGACDVAESLVGRDLGEVAAIGRTLQVPITADAVPLLMEQKPALVFHTTGSRLDAVYEQLATIVAAGANIVSTCEQLSYPYRSHPELADRLHRLAEQHGVTVLGTGINPGFLMDTWPLFMSSVCSRVEHVRVLRVQDASTRRRPFQAKIGAGMTREEFAAAVESGGFGHVGLPESLAMLAAGLGWELGRTTESIEPVVLDHPVRSGDLRVPAGRVVGLKQMATGYHDNAPRIELEFQAYLGAPRSYDWVSLRGNPPLEVTIQDGTPGDVATAAIVVNSAPAVVAAPAGLVTMSELPVVGCRDQR